MLLLENASHHNLTRCRPIFCPSWLALEGSFFPLYNQSKQIMKKMVESKQRCNQIRHILKFKFSKSSDCNCLLLEVPQLAINDLI